MTKQEIEKILQEGGNGYYWVYIGLVGYEHWEVWECSYQLETLFLRKGWVYNVCGSHDTEYIENIVKELGEECKIINFVKVMTPDELDELYYNRTEA